MEIQGSVVRSETQWVRRHHPAILHHGCRDGPHVLEELPGVAGAQSCDVSHDPVMGLGSEGNIESFKKILSMLSLMFSESSLCAK